MFHVRTIRLDERREDAATYNLISSSAEGEQVTSEFARFLAARPPVFREKLPFVQRDLELEWSAAPGGVALASFHTGGAPCSMGILLAGADPDADRLMLQAWRKNVLKPLVPEDADGFALAGERPLLVNALFPVTADLSSAVQLVVTALAAAYFRCVTAGVKGKAS